ncbi:MAG: hypothetical protein NVS3B10_30070 [Polyangiales bacterium]
MASSTFTDFAVAIARSAAVSAVSPPAENASLAASARTAGPVELAGLAFDEGAADGAGAVVVPAGDPLFDGLGVTLAPVAPAS